MTYTQDSRRDGLAVALPHIGPLQASILDALRIHGSMTCREIMTALRSDDLNGVRSRSTELYQAGLLDVCGRRKDSKSGVSVSVYRIVTNSQRELFYDQN